MINNITVWLDETTKLFPNKIAFEDEEKSISFFELRRQALVIASYFVDKKMFKKPIAVVMKKSVEVLITFMAIAYSGNYYTVIDADMPKDRKKKIIEIFAPRQVITDSVCYGECCNLDIEVENILKVGCIEGSASESDVLAWRDKGIDTDLLYVLFTSGSTGIPKGVTICHRSVIDYIECIQKDFEMTDSDILGNQAPFYFDNSVLDIYTSIKTGATLIIIPKVLFSQPVKLLEFLKNKKVSVIFWVPSALIVVANLHALKKVDLNGSLKKVLFCGEVMPTKQLNEWMKYLPDAMYVNLYGPTEITDACTYYRVNRIFSEMEPLPIGRAMFNTDIMVLNERDELVSGDEKGELCVRGISLSLGYYNNLEKTKDVFVQNPLNTHYREYIYRTGDIVHYNERGELIYDSRKDFQIKHMGHRIELGEIETIAGSFAQVYSNCCIYDDKRKRIILYYVGDINSLELKEFLSSKLPEYMLPSKIIQKDFLPLTGNGKIDRKKIGEEYR